ncbi:MAG: hypothetical protein M3434_05250, partial [Gemmatimonadota bacterium]|nr:hypothetical protein [Gemmatimonadota bacterium]
MRYRAWQTFSAQSRRPSHRADRVAEVAPRPAFACRQCGAGLKWSPGDEQLACPYCGALNDAPAAAAAIEELDYHTHLAQVATEQATQEVLTTKCSGCGAEWTMDANIVAGECPFCAHSVVLTGQSSRLIKPASLLPFRVTRRDAEAALRTWSGKLWLAPNDFRDRARRTGGITGIYIPYWTYDCDADTRYRGQRGEYYYVTVNYTTTENGKTVRRQRQERRTRWYPASGRVFNHFDDVLVVGSTALPGDVCEALEPWDLPSLVPYADEYVSGFRAQSYSVDLPTGFENAKQAMQGRIEQSVCADIGGDTQQIYQLDTRYSNITFKHLLLPVWISAYRYK